MPPILLRSCLIALGLFVLLLGTVAASPAAQPDPGDTIPPVAPVLQNPDFECATGFYSATNPAGERIRLPSGWQIHFTAGAPETNSTRREVTRNCDSSTDQHIERISGLDSWIIKSEDLESSPAPGKPFDVSLYQQVSATVGGAYSLSGWMVSLCGGSRVPNDCPEGYYIAKLIGIDPTGGVDPLADTVVWTEDRRNFVEDGQRVGLVNLSTVAVAQAPTITIFARINSPFQWHGNHAIVDAFSLIRAPAARLNIPTIVSGTALTLSWAATQSPDVIDIPSGNYELLVDIDYRSLGATAWQPLLRNAAGTGSQLVSAGCPGAQFEFRIRARAEQPEGEPGAFPTQRYPGIWSEPVAVRFERAAAAAANSLQSGENAIHLPLVHAYRECELGLE
jgi:hypothetical protein